MLGIILFIILVFSAYYLFDILILYVSYLAHKKISNYSIRYVSLDTIKDMTKDMVIVYNTGCEPYWYNKPLVLKDNKYFYVLFLSYREMVQVSFNRTTCLICKSFKEYRKVIKYIENFTRMGTK